ncbi:lysophospholipid acyltransferase family protein [Rhodovibrionaceae bacterium A322]
MKLRERFPDLRYRLEAAGLFLALGFLGLLPVDASSNFGGWLGRTFGPRLGIARRARRSLALAMPELSDSEREKIVKEMFDNLGRTAFEYPHLGEISDPASGRVEVINDHYLFDVKAQDKALVVFSAHLANWEVMPIMAARRNLELIAIVRLPNNPYVQGVVDRLRGVAGGQRVGKGSKGARIAMKTLEQGGNLALLCDQKMNNGIEARFFGLPAMTAPAAAQLALRYDVPLMPVRVERTGPARFRLTCFPELPHEVTGKRSIDVLTATQAINDQLEAWIRERPAEWLWLHKRWAKDLY